MLGTHGLVPVRDGIKYDVFRFDADALALDAHMEESLGAEVSLVPDSWLHYGQSRRTVAAFEYRVIESF